MIFHSESDYFYIISVAMPETPETSGGWVEYDVYMTEG